MSFSLMDIDSNNDLIEMGSPIKGGVKRKNTSPLKKIGLFFACTLLTDNGPSSLQPTVPRPLLHSYWFSASA